MNKNIKIKIKTPVGETESKEVGPCLAQGLAETGIASAVNLENGVKSEFHDNDENEEEEEVGEKETISAVKYEDVTLHPLLFQDDVLNAAETIKDAQIANNKMERIVESKLLDLNLDKSSYIIAGNGKEVRKLKQKLDQSPLVLCGSLMKSSLHERYLGCQLTGTVAGSVAATVAGRLGLASRAVYEIRTVVEDRRSDILGGVSVALKLWEQSVVPMLLYGSCVWFNIPKNTMKNLTDLNNQFLKSTMGVGKYGCPIPSLYLQTATLTMPNRILQSQLLFLHHVGTLPIESLGREVYELQQRNENLPGIIKSCKEVLIKWNALNFQDYSKYQWRKFVKRQIKSKNSKELVELSRGYKKIKTEEYENCDLQIKDYLLSLNLSDARILFRYECELVQTIHMNFKSHRRYKEENYLCPDCLTLDPPVSHTDSQEALLSCDGNSDLRRGLNLGNQKHLATYLKAVVSRRNLKHGG